jgi:hypothetical protein
MRRTNTTYNFLLCHAFSLAKLHQIAGTISWERTAKGFGFPFPRREMIMITVTHGKMKNAPQTEGDMDKLINFSLQSPVFLFLVFIHHLHFKKTLSIR